MTGRELIQVIKRHGGRITGSYARGEESPNSDYDFYIPTSHWRHFVKSIPQTFESCICGHIALRTDDLGLIEVSDIFERQNGIDKIREIEGVEFKTW